jgi:cytochrome c5
MSQAQHNDASQAKSGSDPMSVAIWVGLGAVALIVAIILLARFAIGAYSARSLEGSAAMAPEALAKRIGPVAQLQIEGAPPVAVAAATAPAKVATVAAPAKAGKADGKSVYDSACVACHGTGVANSPKFGDKAAWAPRIKTGNDALYASALKGKNAMPARGGNATLGDEAVKAAVDYMVAAGK